MIPPIAFHVTDRCGTDGGFKLKLPDKWKCGNGGKLILGILRCIPEKNPLIALTIPEIVDLAA